jgi:hypothetical protein
LSIAHSLDDWCRQQVASDVKGRFQLCALLHQQGMKGQCLKKELKAKDWDKFPRIRSKWLFEINVKRFKQF